MSAAIYGTEVSRCVASVGGSDDTLFVVGTQKLRGNNEIHLVAHDRDRNTLTNRAVWTHHPEIWDLTPCPGDGRLIATIYNPSTGGANYGGAVWRLPGGTSATDVASSSSSSEKGGGGGAMAADRQPLESASSLVGLTGKAQCVRWNETHTGVLATVDEAHVKVWSIDDKGGGGGGGAAVCTGESAVGPEGASPAGAAWDPNDPEAIAVAVGSSIAVFDVRCMAPGPAQTVRNAHALQVRDVDYNPKRSHVLATAGDDGKIRLWDMRAHEAPLEELAGHSHWVWRAKFNPVYDELIVSASSDATVRLWRDGAHSSSSSTAEGGGDDDDDSLIMGSFGKGGGGNGGNGGSGGADRGGGGGSDFVGEVQVYDDHEDSVYGAVWSAADPWTFASLSYDGRLALNVVPRAEKYRILL